MRFNTDLFIVALLALPQFATATAVCKYKIKKGDKEVTAGRIWPGSAGDIQVDGEWGAVSASTKCRFTLTRPGGAENYTVVPDGLEESEEEQDTPGPPIRRA
ncbi:hypothetical protein PpBr36_01063 [Pyricularia pennisetigena]|uniref:hypothetical protein n=1 Tax=Pyricularia pennisetigena TaxID=1578925 RepID=UPI00114F0597|nr:hypothetical protein PpBr36_01063 [Pyricularia pennisetigena]TLS28679.1 hypothetical protein PpBr36_01063 [Pyricularia pennisetigena]